MATKHNPPGPMAFRWFTPELVARMRSEGRGAFGGGYTGARAQRYRDGYSDGEHGEQPAPNRTEDYAEGYVAGRIAIGRDPLGLLERAKRNPVAVSVANPASRRALAKYHALMEAGSFDAAAKVYRRIHGGLKGHAKRKKNPSYGAAAALPASTTFGAIPVRSKFYLAGSARVEGHPPSGPWVKTSEWVARGPRGSQNLTSTHVVYPSLREAREAYDEAWMRYHSTPARSNPRGATSAWPSWATPNNASVYVTRVMEHSDGSWGAHFHGNAKGSNTAVTWQASGRTPADLVRNIRAGDGVDGKLPSTAVSAFREATTSGERGVFVPEGSREVFLALLGKGARSNPRYTTGAYAERVKLPKRAGRAPIGEASVPYIQAAFRGTDHTAALEASIRHANAAARAYNRTMRAAYATHGEMGPPISGVGQEHFPAKTKDLLRKQLRAFNAAQDAAALHYKALGKRTPFSQSAYANQMVKAGGYGYGNAR